MADTFKAACTLMEHGGKILILLRTDGRWGLPGGGVEPGEEVQAAAAREIYEETGYKVEKQKLSLLFVNDQPIKSTKSGKDIIFTLFRLEVPKMFEVKLDPNEHTDFMWVTPKEALRIKNTVPDMAEMLRKAYSL